MKFPSLDIENFLTIGKAKIDLSDRGLLGIQGINNADSSATSNGSGKSTIADALCWVLYGVTARDVSGDHVVNRTAGKDCMVQVLIEDGDKVYRAARHRKHAHGKNGLILFEVLPTRCESDLTQGTDKLTQEKLEQILGCSYEVFRAAVYLGQEAMPDLPGLTDKQLKVLVEEAAGITVLEAAYEIAKKRGQETKAATATAAAALGIAETSLLNATEQLAEAEREKGFWVDEQAADIAAAQTVIETARDGMDTVFLALSASNKAKLLIVRDALNAKLAGISLEGVREKELDGAAIAANNAVARLDTTFSALRGAAQRVKHDLDHIDGKTGTECGECGKEYAAEDLAGASTAQRVRLGEKISEASAAKKLVDAASLVAAAAADALSAYRATMTDATSASASLVAVNDKLEAIAKLESQIAAHDAAQEERGKALDVLTKKMNPWPAKIAARAGVVTELAKGHAEARAACAQSVEALALAEDAVKVFSPAGVRAQILDTVTPYLNERTAHYLGTLSDGNINAVWTTLARTGKGELREKFTIDVTHLLGGETFKAISGGEKRKVRLGCALALQDLVATRASKPIDLFIGDEIDDALDDAGMERLMTVLDEKSRERGSVIIVSHNSLRDWIRAVVTIEKTGGYSTLVE